MKISVHKNNTDVLQIIQAMEEEKMNKVYDMKCQDDEKKMKRFLDVEKSTDNSQLLGDFEFFGHISQPENFFFGSQCLINSEIGNSSSEKAAKMRRKKIRKPFGLEPLDATFRKYGIAEIRGSFGDGGKLEGEVWIRMGDDSLIQVRRSNTLISSIMTVHL